MEEDLLRGMCSVLRHRGPDDVGVWSKRAKGEHEGPWFGLGHCRLSIIDLTEAARQPMCNEDESIWLSFNGEIYNFMELRKGLQSRGHRFRSGSDAEVILHLYEEKGERLLEDLRGMFAFGLVDTRYGRLMLARDRLGQKPLVYATPGKNLLFASESKALLMDPELDVSVNLNAINCYLSLQYIPSPMSAYLGIRRLPPAHCLMWEDGTIRLMRYWAPQVDSLDMEFTQAADEVLALLQESVSLRMVGDVPIGAFLSGGLDSSAVVALMSRASREPVTTLTVSFGDGSRDEGTYATEVARAFGTAHGEVQVRESPLEELQRLVKILDEPLADPAVLPTYVISRAMRESVKVALSGEGGDEVFGGYARYRAVKYHSIYVSLPEIIKRSLIPWLLIQLPVKGWARTHWMHRLRLFAALHEDSIEGCYANWISHFPQRDKEQICTDEFLAFSNDIQPSQWIREVVDLAASGDPLQGILLLDLQTYLPDDLLQKVDMASMACSLEVRCPFLDHHLVEFSLGLPVQWKVGWTKGKHILRRAFSRVLPRSIVRRSKVGFTPPIDRWIREELRELVIDTLTDETARKRGYFRTEMIERMIREHMEGVRNRHYQIWNLLMLELWHRNYMDDIRVLKGQSNFPLERKS